MSGLTREEVRHVAELARLALTDDEIEALRPQLSAILDYAGKVGEVAAPDVEPMSHAVSLVNVFREDVAHRSLSQSEALATAPAAEDGRFRVPRIVAEET